MFLNKSRSSGHVHKLTLTLISDTRLDLFPDNKQIVSLHSTVINPNTTSHNLITHVEGGKLPSSL